LRAKGGGNFKFCDFGAMNLAQMYSDFGRGIQSSFVTARPSSSSGIIPKAFQALPTVIAGDNLFK